MMMPPKKSKAARENSEQPIDQANGDVPQDPSRDSESEGEKNENNDEPKKQAKGYIEPGDDFEEKTLMYPSGAEVVEGKRKREKPAAEQKLHDWVNEHLEPREETRVAFSEVYSSYLEFCVSSGNYGMEETFFRKVVKQKFPNGFGINESSPYKELIKERKKMKKKEKVQADSLKLKMRDIIEEAIKGHGNPTKGVRFHNLKSYISARYPALRVDLRPGVLKNALHRGVYFGHYILVKGVGMCGYFRLEGPPDKEEEDKKVKKEKKKAKEGEEPKENGEKDGEENDAKEGSEAEKEDKKEGEEGDETDGKDKAIEEEKKPKKKAKKPAPKKDYRKGIIHSDPQRIEDSFFMAMTFNSEPKEASVVKIKRYVIDHYGQNLEGNDRLKKAMATGVEKGFWEQVTGGTTTSGTYALLIEEFDPTDDDDLIGQIVNGISACTEPKECSARGLKDYVLEYYPQFKVADRPHLFKKALVRAQDKGFITQVSGIGCTGSFQLSENFTPTPAMLAGQDTASDYEEDESEEEEEDSSAESEEVDFAGYDWANYGDSYTPRPSKRRGFSRASAVANKQGVQMSAGALKKRAKKRKANEVVEERGGRGKSKASTKNTPAKGGKAAKKSGRGRPRKKDSDSEVASSVSAVSEDDSDDDDNQEGYRPRPSSSRGGSGSGRNRGEPPAKKAKTAAKKTGAKAGKASAKKAASPASPSKAGKQAKATPKKEPGKGRGRPPTKADSSPAPKSAPAPKGKGRGRPKKK